MKIGKQKDFRSKKEVTIPRDGSEDFKVTVCTLPLTFSREAERLFPSPQPPMKIVRDSNNKILKDSSGSPLKAPNLDDPTYKENALKNTTLQSVYIFWEATRLDRNLEWDHSIDVNDVKTTDFEILLKELEDAGITFGDLNIVLSAATSMSNLDINNLASSEE